METKRENCIIRCRVSSAKQAREGDSLEDQELVGHRVAARDDWNVVRVFHQPYSASKPEHAMIDEIVEFIQDYSEPIHHLIFKGIDRFTRAGVSDYEQLKNRIEDLGVNLVDSYGLIQPKQNTLDHFGFEYHWSVYAPSEMAEIMEAQRSKQEVRDILTRMIGAEIKLVQDGYKVRRPADGYLNQRIEVEGKKRVIEVPDPDRAPFYRKMFELRASGRYSDAEIVDHINAMGFRSKPQKRWNESRDRVIGHSKPKQLTIAHFQRLILRPGYCGVRVEKWTDWKPVRAQNPGLVSIATFNAANEGKVRIEEYRDGSLTLHEGESRSPIRLKNNPTYPYKNIVLCGDCAKPFLGSASRGKMGKRYPAYHCNRGHYFRVPKDKFENVVDAYFMTLDLDEAGREILRHFLEGVWDRRQRDIQKHVSRVREHQAALKIEQDAVVESLIATTNSIVRQKLESRIAELEAQLTSVKRDAHTSSDVSRADFEDFLSYVDDLMEHPMKWLKNTVNVTRQRAAAELLFEETPTYREITSGTPKLRQFFGLDWLLNDLQSPLVNPQVLDWNSLHQLIKGFSPKGRG